MHLKKFMAIMMSATVVAGMFTGCSSKPAQPTESGQTTEQIEVSKENETVVEEKSEEEVKEVFSQAADPNEVITFWGGGFPDEKIFERFSQETGFKYDYPLSGFDLNKLLVAVTAGAAPDAIFVGMWDIPKLANANAIYAFDDVVTDGSIDWNEYYDWAVELTMQNGKHYALNWDISTIMMYYNRRLFEEAGLDPNKPPTTWKELEDYSKKLTKFDSAGNLVQAGMWAENPHDIDGTLGTQEEILNNKISENPYEINRNTPERVEAWKFTKTLRDIYGGIEAVEKSTAAGNILNFESETVAMTAADPLWLYDSLMTNYPDVSFDLAPLPSKNGNGNAASTFAYWALALPVNSKNSQGGAEICKWFATSGAFGDKQTKFDQDPSRFYTIPLASKIYSEKIMNDFIPNITDPIAQNREMNKFKFITENCIGLPPIPVDFGTSSGDARNQFMEGTMTAEEAIASWDEKDKVAVENYIKEQKAMGLWQE